MALGASRFLFSEFIRFGSGFASADAGVPSRAISRFAAPLSRHLAPGALALGETYTCGPIERGDSEHACVLERLVPMSVTNDHLPRRSPWRLEVFRHFARRTSDRVGSPWAFLIACALIFLWALTGPFFGFSDTWQIVINTVTTIITFLMVFLIQHAQNHDARAMQLKLDELLRAIEAARTGLVDLEEQSEEDLTKLKQEFSDLKKACPPCDDPGHHEQAKQST